MRWRLVAACAAALAGLTGAAGCATDEAPANPVVQPGLPGEGNRTLSAEEAASNAAATPPNEADYAYARDMVAHHRQALVMTALVPDRGADPTVKAFATRIADTQGPEVDMMNRWLTRNGQPAVAEHEGHGGHGSHHAMPGMATEEQLAALAAASGPAFDRLFLELMIRHHEGAISMADTVRRSGSDVLVQEMADNVVAEQSDEVARMRGMLGA
ncbi:DUF305 domain-containing protein [Actinokineospora sp. PR83]|uniref:DUF305 domain-containing protein n=1 Tax=Actinokineospora sp. PR83 TaxID=2884908 RepID=UPI0027E04765|nr:DUF305 domain-containing protein [Actinokineospora sp. PR83]MCG8919225.1 DUF305 domain-containing protein [Actinokineospora sp. PR83]